MSDTFIISSGALKILDPGILCVTLYVLLDTFSNILTLVIMSLYQYSIKTTSPSL